MKNLDKVQQFIEESIWLAHARGLWTHAIDSGKWASKGLKKIIDDTLKWFVHKQSRMNQNENEDTHTFQ
jgi:hypothetical protein